MRKIALHLSLLLLLSSTVQAKEVILKLTCGYFLPAEQAFKDVYEQIKKYNVNLRVGAHALALGRVAEAMKLLGRI